MSTDLLEKTLVEEIPKTSDEIEQERIMAYIPPLVKVADEVFWYRDCNTTKEPFFGRVTRVGMRCLEIQITDGSNVGRIIDGIRYKDDPSLDVNANHRTSGCWDYTNRHMELEAIKKRLQVSESTCAKLDATVATLVAKTEQDGRDYYHAIGNLQERIKELKTLTERVDMLEQLFDKK